MLRARGLVGQPPEAMGSKLKPRGARTAYGPPYRPSPVTALEQGERRPTGARAAGLTKPAVWIELELVEEWVDLECACRTGIAKVQEMFRNAAWVMVDR
jgi:hypothetical protein